MADSKGVIRDSSGKWPKGISGNPKGRPLGAKGRIARLKQTMEEALREGLHPDEFRDIISAMVQEAKNGNVAAAKLVLDKVMSNAKVDEDSNDNDGKIVIKIENFTPGNREKMVDGVVINNEEI